jgi:HEAT repeat protein
MKKPILVLGLCLIGLAAGGLAYHFSRPKPEVPEIGKKPVEQPEPPKAPREPAKREDLPPISLVSLTPPKGKETSARETDVLRPSFGNKPYGNLLWLPKAAIEATTAPNAERPELVALSDDNPRSVATVSAAPTAPLDVVYGFGETTVTVEQLAVRLPARGAGGAVRVEVLVSQTGPHTGFKLVRADPLAPTDLPQVFALPPTGGRWVMVRLVPPDGANRVAVAEVGVFGHAGPPVSPYAFKESPARAIDVLNRLKGLTGLTIPIAADETALFDDAKDGKLDSVALRDALLLASGRTTADERKPYLEKLDALLAAARTDAPEKDPWVRGAKLLTLLHKGPMAKGYESGQTSLSEVLDSGKFNCISSAALYNLLAGQLELDARCVLVPGHAFSIVYEGTRHADVETTAPDGFDPARDPQVGARFTSRTGFRLIPDTDRDQRRETTNLGLVAGIYFNRALDAAAGGNFQEALVGFFKALSIDPELAPAIQATLRTLAFWSRTKAIAGSYDDALQVLAVGLELAPRDATLQFFRKEMYVRWAHEKVRADLDSEALAILRRAHAETKDDDFAAMQADVLVYRSEQLARAGKWAEAVAVADPTGKGLVPAAEADLTAYRVQLRLRWADAEATAGRFDAALQVLADARAAHPQHKYVGLMFAAVIAGWAERILTEQGEAPARSKLDELTKRFADVPEAKSAAIGYVWRATRRLLDKKEFPEAAAFLKRHESLLPGPAYAAILRAVYGAWAGAPRQPADTAKAAEAVADAITDSTGTRPEDADVRQARKDVFEDLITRSAEKGAWDDVKTLLDRMRSAKEDPDEIKRRLLALAVQQARAAYRRGGAEETAKLTKKLRELFPELPEVTDRAARAAVLQLINDLKKAGKYEEALAFVDGAADAFTNPVEARQVRFLLLREWTAGGNAKAHPRLVETLIEALTDYDGVVRAAAAESLGNLSARAAAPALAARVADDRWVVSEYANAELNDPIAGGKSAAVAALRKLAPERVTAALSDALRSPTLGVRVWAASELGRQDDADSLTSLRAALFDGNPWVRRAAADALLVRGNKTAVPDLIKRVADELWFPTPTGSFTYYDEPYDGFRGLGSKDHALNALRKLAFAEVTAALQQAAKSPRDQVRLWATAELGRQPGSPAVATLVEQLNDAKWEVRVKAAEALAGQKDPAAVDALGRALQDSDPRVRRAAADGLGKLADKSAIPALERRVADDLWSAIPAKQSSYTRQDAFDDIKGLGSKVHALDALAKLAPDRVGPALVAAAKSKTLEVRRWAVDEMPRAKSDEVVHFLIGALRDRDPLTRRHAADALAEIGDKSAPVVAALERRIADEVWFPIPEKVSSYRNTDAYDGLDGLGSKDHALTALRKLAPDRVGPALVAALKAAEPGLRRWAADELKAVKTKESVQALAELLKDRDKLLRRIAADSLGAIGDRDALPALEARIADSVWVPLPKSGGQYHDSDAYDGFEGIGGKDHALNALVKIDAKRAGPALLTAAKSENVHQRAWAAKQLGRLKVADKDAVNALINYLKDAEGLVRRSAAEALGEIGDKSAVDPLIERIADDVWVPRPGGSFTYHWYHDAYDGIKDVGSKDRAVDALKKLAPEQVKDALKKAAESKKKEVRDWAEKQPK